MTRLLWYEVEERPEGALRVRRIAAPPGAHFKFIWLVGWLGFCLLFSCLRFPLLGVIPFWIIGGLAFLNLAGHLGIGDEEWFVENDLLVVRRTFPSWSRERRYAGATLEIAENEGHDSHTLSLKVLQGEGGYYLLHMNYPSPEQRGEMQELGMRLAGTTGWKLVTVP